MQISLILPCYNEEKNIENTVNDVLNWFANAEIDGELIVVNDGSQDDSATVLERLSSQISNLMVLTHEKNRGYGEALRTGLDAATKEWMGYMDSDGQFRTEDFEKLLPYTEQVDFVTGRRFQRADPFIRKLNAKLFGGLNFLVLGIWVHDINCAMKMWKRDIWSQIRPTVATGALFNAEMFYRLKQQRITWKQVFVDHYPRLYGEQTGANIRVILRMFRDLLRLRFRV